MYLEFQAISKRFPGVQALDDVSFGVAEGEVHALIGENGAGKSTLLKLLGGSLQPTSGALWLAQQERHFASAREALAAGIAVIQQELQLVPERSVAENLFLGHLPAQLGWVNRRRLMSLATEQLALVGEERIHPATLVSALPIGQRQMVELAKALTRGAKVVAFDEPTSSLSEREVQRLFSIIRELKARGQVVLYVSHKLEELFQVCDSATVLRDGRLIETFPALKGVTQETLVARMVGRELADIFNYAPRPVGKTVLQVEQLEGPGLAAPLSLELRRGEVVGIFGLVGAGRTELLKLLFGARRATGGQVLFEGVPLRLADPRDAIRAGLVLCPEDRRAEGIIPVRPVMENLNLAAHRRLAPLGIISPARERLHAAALVEQLDVKTPSLRQLIMHLSGGNQQKVVLGRWLATEPKVLLLDEPTRGIDVGARSELYSLIQRLASQGVAVLMASSDLPEVLGLSDRVLVMKEGRLAGEFERSQATPAAVMKLALPA